MQKKYILASILIIALALAVIRVFVLSPKQTPTSSDTVGVAASFYPLAYLAQEIGGSLVQVTNVTPAGVEPHDFEPSPRDINNIYKTKLFIFNGGSIDTWAGKIRPTLETQGIAAIDMIFETRDLLPNPDTIDPHLWLDPNIMSREADAVASALIRIDPAHAQEYNRNKNRLQKNLAILDEEYRAGLANCQLREIITSHDAFGYLANRYDFKVLSILGLSPEEEPSPKKIAEISQLAKSRGIKYIFFESLVSPKLAQTIADEIGAHTLVLNPIEGLLEQDTKNNEDYITLMQKNLANLKIAMICQNSP